MISAIANSSVNATQHARPKPEDVFKKMDTDGDGSVSQQEFESAFVSISQKGGQAASSADTADLKAKADAIYKKMDSDGDGKLSAAEFQTAAKAQEGAQGAHGHHGHGGGGGGGAAAGASQAKTYDPADTNKDGVVSAQEAEVYQVSQQAKAALSNGAAEAVKAYSGVEEASS